MYVCNEQCRCSAQTYRLKLFTSSFLPFRCYLAPAFAALKYFAYPPHVQRLIFITPKYELIQRNMLLFLILLGRKLASLNTGDGVNYFTKISPVF